MQKKRNKMKRPTKQQQSIFIGVKRISLNVVRNKAPNWNEGTKIFMAVAKRNMFILFSFKWKLRITWSSEPYESPQCFFLIPKCKRNHLLLFLQITQPINFGGKYIKLVGKLPNTGLLRNARVDVPKDFRKILVFEIKSIVLAT